MDDLWLAVYLLVGAIIAVCAIPPDRSRLYAVDYFVTVAIIAVWPVFLVYSVGKAVRGWR